MNKIAYEIVSLEVEKMYLKSEEFNDDQLNEQFLFIDQFIESCGWDVHQFWEHSVIQKSN